MKCSFKNDYSEGCHPDILQALIATNMHQQAGYGQDDFCKEAAEMIREKFSNPDAAVHFVSGGTQANLTVIASILRPYESVVSACTGHIFTNESGAIEATGHKVHGTPTDNGKITTNQVADLIAQHANKPHQLKQKLVYISNSTELGTLYSKNELSELSAFCKQNELYLFLDGARLGHALTAETNDLTPEDIAKYTDVFYLGGTKNGALIGEAIVINNPILQEEFAFNIKQRGAMLAKSRLLGIQFVKLMKNNLYFDLANHANIQSMKLKEAFKVAGCSFLTETFTNQIFPILKNEQIEKLSEDFDFYVWEKIDEDFSAIRIITSWATEESDVNKFCEKIAQI